LEPIALAPVPLGQVIGAIDVAGRRCRSEPDCRPHHALFGDLRLLLNAGKAAVHAFGSIDEPLDCRAHAPSVPRRAGHVIRSLRAEHPLCYSSAMDWTGNWTGTHIIALDGVPIDGRRRLAELVSRGLLDETETLHSASQRLGL